MWVHILGDPQSVQLRNATTKLDLTKNLLRKYTFPILLYDVTSKLGQGHPPKSLHYNHAKFKMSKGKQPTSIDVQL